MSSRGQVVIPEEIRTRLGFRAGSQFVVVGENDAVVLKAISPPAMEEFEDLLSEARQQVGPSRAKRSDVTPRTAGAPPPNPVVEAYKEDIDRSLIRENLKLSHQGRLENLIRLQRFADDLRRANPRSDRKRA